jgi:hypothetical protein
MLFSNLTPVDQIVLASVVGGVSGCAISAVSARFQPKTEENRVNNEKSIRDAALTSIAMGLFSGALVFAFASIDVDYVERVDPRVMFVLVFTITSIDGVIKLIQQAFSKILIKN